MSTDLESQLRVLGTLLDNSVEPVTSGDITARTITDVNAGSHQLNGSDADHSVAVLAEVNTSGTRRWAWALSVAASALIVGLISAFVLVGRSELVEGPIGSTPRSTIGEPAGTTPVSSASKSQNLEAIPRVAASVVPLDTTLPRADVYPLLPGDDIQTADVFASYAQHSSSNPRRLVALVGRIEGDQLTEGILIQTVNEHSPDTFSGEPQQFTIGDDLVDVYTGTGSPGTSTAILGDDEMVLITGLDPVSFLRQVGTGFVTARWSADTGALEIDEGSLPDGYEIIIEPHSYATPGSLYASTSIGTASSNSDSAEITVSLFSPIPLMAAGEDLERTDINGLPGWIAVTPPYLVVWKASDSTWASLSIGGNTSADAAVQLARDIEFVDEATWRERYEVPEPLFGAESGQTVAINRGRNDGLQIGMPVVNSAGLVGKLISVTDTSSEVLLLSDPRFSLAATVEPDTTQNSQPEQTCAIQGRNDHLALNCSTAFGPGMTVGAIVTTAGGDSLAPNGILIGPIAAIQNNAEGEQIAILDTHAVPVSGDNLTVLIYQP